jgi:hypothetical protein
MPIDVPPRGLAVAILTSLALVVGCASAPPTDDSADAAKVAAAAAAGAAAAAASRGPNAGAAAPGATAGGGAAAAAAAAAAGPKPFAEVIKDATPHKGYFTLYTKDDKTWIELAPGDFDKPFFFSVNLARGIGENFLFGGLMGPSHLAEWHKVGNNVQLVALNETYFATPQTPEARAVADAFSNSLLAAAPVVSQPEPATHGVLAELNVLLLADIPGGNGELERAYRQPYAFDAKNSSISATHVTDDSLGVAVEAHYALARVVQPPAPPSTAPYTPPPATLPDIRSLFLGYYYNFAKLPDQPMHARLADPRIGYFTTTRYDYSDDRTLSPRINLVERWRLEKKDPSAPLSEPRQPIVYWLDRNIPLEYRDTVIAGILEWNKAFEKIGFKNAIVAKIQPDDADFDTMDARHASIRWMLSARPIFGGIGPSQVDPRTGEILDADIGIDPVRIRNRRALFTDQVDRSISVQHADTLFPMTTCMADAAEEQEAGFALDLLEARGDIAPGSAAEQKFILDDLKETVMHEVGHTLGLTHNFRASTIYTRAQLDDPAFTAQHGVSGSVMEYNGINLALAGEKQGAFSMPTLGPYDYWAIEYGYKEIPQADEKAELRRIAGRSTEHDLVYAFDSETATGIDPNAAVVDLSDDPLDFAHRRVLLTEELWSRWEVRSLPDGDSLAAYRRSVVRGLMSLREAGIAASRYVGGVSLYRDVAGSGRTPLNPVDPAQQRAALKLVEDSLFSADSFRFPPEFMRKLSVDWLNQNDAFDVGLNMPGYTYSLPTQVLLVQKAVLDRVMSDATAQRLLDSLDKVDAGKHALQLSELYGSLHAAIFSELRTGHDIPLLRRNLQREYVMRLGNDLLRSSATMPADARAVARADAKALRDEIAAAQKRAGYSADARAHLAESQQALDEALKAPVVRNTL